MTDRFHTILRVERAEQLTSGQHQPTRRQDARQVQGQDPATLLEQAEQIPEPSHQELAHALGRILVWQLDGETLARIGERVIVTAYKLRPDLIAGATMRQLARKRGIKKSYFAKVATQFTRIFGIRGINSHSNAGEVTSRRSTECRARAYGVPSSHLAVVNRFNEWRAFMDEAGGSIPSDPQARRAMLDDLRPILAFAEDLEG